eukprot:m.70137 g.70137  ORF g.70137 m.70137 type:complete len:449 (-) comp12249_c3_seq1:441-1787(-)
MDVKRDEASSQGGSSGTSWFKHRRSLSADNSSLDSQREPAQTSMKERLMTLRSGFEAMLDKLTRDSASGIDFLAPLKKAAQQDVAAQLRTFIDRFDDEGPTLSVTSQSELVQQFYQDMEDRLYSHDVYSSATDEQRDSVMLGIERHLTHHIYHIVFRHLKEEDEEDVKFYNKVKQLRWIRPHHLDAAIDMLNEEVVKEVDAAQDELLTIDAMRAPQDKLRCIQTCAQTVFSILRKSASTQAAGADDFLPALIFVLIKAHPSRFKSNLKFIQLFGLPSYLSSGEAAYYYTNLEGAIHHIASMDAASLKLDQEQWDKLMTGDASAAVEGLESIEAMKEYLDRLTSLETKAKVMKRDVSVLLHNVQMTSASTVRPLDFPDTGLTDYSQRLARLSKSRKSLSSPASPTTARRRSSTASLSARQSSSTSLNDPTEQQSVREGQSVEDAAGTDA